MDADDALTSQHGQESSRLTARRANSHACIKMDSSDERLTIATNCKRFRDEAGLTQEEVAARADLSHASVSRYETGRSVPDRDSMRKLAALYGRTVEHFYLSDPPPPVVRMPAVRLKVETDGEVPTDIMEEVRVFQRGIDRKLLDRALAAKAVGRRGKKL